MPVYIYKLLSILSILKF